MIGFFEYWQIKIMNSIPYKISWRLIVSTLYLFSMAIVVRMHGAELKASRSWKYLKLVIEIPWKSSLAKHNYAWFLWVSAYKNPDSLIFMRLIYYFDTWVIICFCISEDLQEICSMYIFERKIVIAIVSKQF